MEEKKMNEFETIDLEALDSAKGGSDYDDGSYDVALGNGMGVDDGDGIWNAYQRNMDGTINWG